MKRRPSEASKYNPKARSRVLIRKPTRADGDEFTALIRASRKLHRPWIRQMPVDSATYAKYLKGWRRKGHAALLICRRDDGCIVGMVNASNIVRGSLQSAYLGYFVGGPYAGQGYMTEGLKLVLRYAFTELKLHRVEANIQPGNRPSIAVVRRCGFRKEGFSRRYLKIRGRWRDHERWALLVEDWKGAKR